MAQGLSERGVSVTAVCSYHLPRVGSSARPQGVAWRFRPSWGRLVEVPQEAPASPRRARAVVHVPYRRRVAAHGAPGRQSGGGVPPSLFMLAVPSLTRRGVRIVGIVHDLQGVYAARKSGLASRLIEKAISFVERRAFDACDHLIFLSETMRDVTLRAYDIERSKTSVHYPFVTIPDVDVQRHASRLDMYFDSGRKSLVYSGALGEKQAPDKLVSLFIRILDLHPDWEARIFSQGPVFERLKQEVRHERLRFYPLVDAELLPALLNRSDVQVVPQEAGTSDGSLPSKLPNIMAAGARVLCITDQGSELEKLVGSYSAGEVSTTWDMDACILAFRRVAVKDRPSVAHVETLLRQFTLEGLIDRIVNLEGAKK
ncbi:MAG: glycosyltransferase [Aquabacterium sp.]